MTSDQTYRGLTCHEHSIITNLPDYAWYATDDDGCLVAHAATLDELKAEIDAYLEDE